MSENQSLITNVLNLCEIYDEILTNNILKSCKSVSEFFTNNEKWSSYGLKKEQVQKILKFKGNLDKALLKADALEILEKNFPEEENNEETFVKFCNEKSDEEIPVEILKWAFKNRKKLLFKPSVTEIAVQSSLHPMNSFIMNSIIPKLAELSRINPGYFEILTSVGDEIFSFINKCNLSASNVIEGNVISSAIIFGGLSIYSFCHRWKDYENKKKEGKATSFAVDVWKPFGIDTAANAAVSLPSAVGGILGAAIFSFIPGLGSFIGGMIGSFLGALLGKSCIEPLVKTYFSRQTPELLNLMNEEDLYKHALEKLNLNEHASIDDVKKVRRQNFLNWHPDKHNQLDENKRKEFTEKLIELEFYYKTVETFRKARNQWE